MAWTQPLPKIITNELEKIPWENMTSTKPIEERIFHLERLLYSANDDFQNKLSDTGPLVEASLEKADNLINEMETALIVIKNCRRNLSTTRLSLFEALRWVCLFRKKDRLNCLINMTAQIKIMNQHAINLQLALLVKSSKPIDLILSILDKIEPLKQSLSNFDESLLMKKQIQSIIDQSMNKCHLKLTEIMRTVVLDPDSIPLKYSPEDLKSTYDRMSRRTDFADFVISAFRDCIETVSRNSGTALKEGADHAGTIVVSLIEFLFILWKRFAKVADLLNEGLINKDLQVWDACAQVIRVMAANVELDSLVFQQLSEIYKLVVSFDSIKPSKGLRRSLVPVFEPRIDRFLAQSDDKIINAVSNCLHPEDLIETAAALSEFLKWCSEFCLSFPGFEGNSELACQRATKMFLLRGMEIYGEIPDFVSHLVDEDIYDSQEKCLARQRHFMIMEVFKMKLSRNENVRIQAKSKSSKFLYFERLQWLEICNQIRLCDNKTKSLISACSEFIRERICSDLLSESMTNWCNSIIKITNEGGFILVPTRTFISELTQVSALDKKLSKSISRVVAMQCIEIVGLIPTSSQIENDFLESLHLLQDTCLTISDTPVDNPPNDDFATGSSSSSNESRRYAVPSYWNDVFEYHSAMLAKTNISETTEWCKIHSQLPLRILAALISRKFGTESEEALRAFSELENFFTILLEFK